MSSHVWIVLVVVALAVVVAVPAADGPLTYPATRRVDHTDDYHGTLVPDPYRWLEDDVRKSPDVAAWVADENNVTEAFLKSIASRSGISLGNASVTLFSSARRS